MAATNHAPHREPLDLRIQPPEQAVEAIRQQLLGLLDDCVGFDCERLRWRLHTCECARDLWLLRGAIFQTICSQHCKAQAERRIDGMVPAFERVDPALPALSARA